jgi:hypothetical protein
MKKILFITLLLCFLLSSCITSSSKNTYPYPCQRYYKVAVSTQGIGLGTARESQYYVHSWKIDEDQLLMQDEDCENIIIFLTDRDSVKVFPYDDPYY